MRILRFALLTLVMMVFVPGADGGAGVPWVSQAAESKLAFSVWYEGEDLSGSFDDFKVKVLLDEGGSNPVVLEVEVRTGSADMNDREINEELMEPEWFDSASFPLAAFTSSAIQPVASGYLASGQLRLKGITQELDLPLQWERDGDRGRLSGSVVLSRREWQVGTGEWASDASLADRVEVRYEVMLAPER
jgi:polyisoprenoid-binding protein YceI